VGGGGRWRGGGFSGRCSVLEGPEASHGSGEGLGTSLLWRRRPVGGAPRATVEQGTAVGKNWIAVSS
jgi:hypothetical protein